MKNVISLALLTTAFSGLFQASPALDALTPPEPRPDSEMHRRSFTLVEEVRQRGDTALPKLARSFSSLAYEYRDYALDLLQAMGTEGARALLLDAAYGRLAGAEHLTKSAALRYLNSMSDPREAVRLLDAKDTSILNSALMALRGLPVEGELWERLKPVLLHGSWWARRDCAVVLYVDSSEELGEEKARAILESLGSAWLLPDGDQSARLVGDDWQTVQTFFFRKCLNVLAEAGPITLAHLQGLEEPLSEIQRKCLMLARALRGDEEARPEYCRVMEHDDDPQLRWAVTGAFWSISRAEDMPLLERIGTADPYWMEVPAEVLENPGMEWLKEQGGIVYPVRDAAGKQIAYLRDKTRPGRAPWIKPDRRADAMPWTPPPGAVFYQP
jgi:hypothetical protein